MIAKVVASEIARAQTNSRNTIGVRTSKVVEQNIGEDNWKVTRHRVKVP